MGVVADSLCLWCLFMCHFLMWCLYDHQVVISPLHEADDESKVNLQRSKLSSTDRIMTLPQLMAVVFAAKFVDGLPCSSTAYNYLVEKGNLPAKVHYDGSKDDLDRRIDFRLYLYFIWCIKKLRSTLIKGCSFAWIYWLLSFFSLWLDFIRTSFFNVLT